VGAQESLMALEAHWYTLNGAGGYPASPPLDPTNLSGTSGHIQAYSSLYAGILGYTSGTPVWVGAWTPVTSDASPLLTFPDGWSGNHDSVQIANNHYPGLYGTLLLTATVDGVPVQNTLKLVIASQPGGSYGYGTVGWNTLRPAAVVGFWTGFLQSYEVL
jgi:hypothetical protein